MWCAGVDGNAGPSLVDQRQQVSTQEAGADGQVQPGNTGASNGKDDDGQEMSRNRSRKLDGEWRMRVSQKMESAKPVCDCICGRHLLRSLLLLAAWWLCSS